jgi:hypothetical protein
MVDIEEEHQMRDSSGAIFYRLQVALSQLNSLFELCNIWKSPRGGLCSAAARGVLHAGLSIHQVLIE